MSTIAPHRIFIIEALKEISEGKHADLVLEQYRGDDRGTVQHILLGILRWRGSLDQLIASCVKKNPKRAIRDILRLALFEHFFCHTPSHAAIHQAVELTRYVGKERKVNL